MDLGLIDEMVRIRTNDQLAEALQALSRRCGLSLGMIESKTRDWGKQDGLQQLRRSTVNDAFLGKSRITKPLLLSILTVCEQPPAAQQTWMAAWERAMRAESRDRLRVDEATPRDLGIHNAITTPDTTEDLPWYVPRDFDFTLRTALFANGPDRGSFVIMVGGSAAGKTRSLYEAVNDLIPDWSLVQPAEASELLELKSAPPRKTVFWLDELQHHLGSDPPLTSECVRALIRHGNIVVGTLWPDRYAASSASEDIRRLLKSAVAISEVISTREWSPIPDDTGVLNHFGRCLIGRGALGR